MKKLIVYQEGVEKIELFDDQDDVLGAFAQRVSQLLKASTVSIINTTDASLIVRPSKVISILIQDQSETVKVTPSSKTAKAKKKSKEKVDIITDVDK